MALHGVPVDAHVRDRGNVKILKRSLVKAGVAFSVTVSLFYFKTVFKWDDD